jgi:hypothetical protein
MRFSLAKSAWPCAQPGVDGPDTGVVADRRRAEQRRRPIGRDRVPREMPPEAVLTVKRNSSVVGDLYPTPRCLVSANREPMIGKGVPSLATLKAETVPLPAPACAFEANGRPGVVERNSLPNGPAAARQRASPAQAKADPPTTVSELSKVLGVADRAGAQGRARRTKAKAPTRRRARAEVGDDRLLQEGSGWVADARAKLKAGVEPDVFPRPAAARSTAPSSTSPRRRYSAYGTASSADPGVASRCDRRRSP